MKRRDLLKAGSLASCSPGLSVVRAAGAGTVPGPSGQVLDRARWSTIAAVQDHLLSSEPDAPGAREVNAAAYLDRTLADPGFDPDIKRFILDGIGWLEALSQEQEGWPFHQVVPARREDLLRRIAGSGAGERWLSNLITYCLEALLADPLK